MPPASAASVLSPKTVGRTLGALFAFASAAVLILGFGKLGEMTMTVSELYSATVQTLLLASSFACLAVLMELWWRAVDA